MEQEREYGALVGTKVNLNYIKIHFRTVQNTHTFSVSLCEENVTSLNLNLMAHKANYWVLRR